MRILISFECHAEREKLIPWLQKTLEAALRTPIEIVTANSAKQTLTATMDRVFDLVIIDDNYDDLSSPEPLIRDILALDRHIPIVVLSTAKPAFLNGIKGWYQFPLSAKDIWSIAEFIRHEKKTERQSNDPRS